MIYDGWASIAGNELWNNARTYAYAMGANLRPCRLEMKCPNNLLPAALGDVPYTDPVTDSAIWVDGDYPESEQFAGFWVTSVEGVDGSHITRSVTPAIGNGGSLGLLRYGPREIVITGWLIGKTCCATSYGLRWLTAALADPSPCGGGCSGCEGDTLCVLRCVPRPEELDLDECDMAPITDLEQIALVETAADRFARSLHSVGLVSGPTILKQEGMGCGCCGCSGIVQVEITLVAGNPWLWLEPEVCLEPSVFDFDFGPECSVEWHKHSGDGYCQNCPTPTDCADDPTCPAPPTPPTVPTVPYDCACVPLVTTSLCCTAEAGDWFDAVAVIEIYGGTDGLHNMVVRGYQNAAGLDPSYFRDCDACLSIAISYVPPFSTLHIDGVSRRITLDCPDAGCEPADALVFDADGTPFSWIELTCKPTTICVAADAYRTSADATVGIAIVGREPV